MEKLKQNHILSSLKYLTSLIILNKTHRPRLIIIPFPIDQPFRDQEPKLPLSTTDQVTFQVKNESFRVSVFQVPTLVDITSQLAFLCLVGKLLALDQLLD
jgi:hypothetical protein